MPSTMDNEMPLLGSGDLHWVAVRRDASEGPKPAMAALMTPELLGRGGSPGERKTKKNKSSGLGFGWLVGPAAAKSKSTPGEAVGQALQGFRVIRRTRLARSSPGFGEHAEAGRSGTKKRKMLWMVKYGEGPAREAQGSKDRSLAPYPLSGGKLTMTDWQLHQAKDHMGLPTPARSEATLVDGNGAKRRPAFPEAWWIHKD